METGNLTQAGISTLHKARADLADAAGTVARGAAEPENALSGAVREALAENPLREARAEAGAELIAAEDRMLGSLLDKRA